MAISSPEEELSRKTRRGLIDSAIVLMGGLCVLTDLAIYKPAQLHWFTALAGGYEWARWEHFWLSLGYVGFFAIHIAQMIRARWPNFRSMVSGCDLAKEEAASGD